MRSFVLATSLIATASTALAGTASIINACPAPIYLTLTRSTQASTSLTLAANGTYSEPLAGTGNSLGVTKTPDYYSATTPKLIWGYSVTTSDGLVYWSINDVDGDAFAGQGFVVTTSNPACAGASSYDGLIHACGSATSLVLTLC